jgi:hypothetical protein
MSPYSLTVAAGLQTWFTWLVASGAFVTGTLIRAMCWPVTYGQEKKECDKRTFLETKGAPTLFLKRLQNSSTRNQLLTIGAF